MSYAHIFLQHLFIFPLFNTNLKGLEVRGLENIRELEGPVIFVANHSSHADTAAILRVLPNHMKERLFIAAAEDYFYKNKLVAGCVSSVLNTFPFDRHDVRKSLSDSKRLLEAGNSLLIYPEGSRDQRKKSFKRGFAILAAECNLPVVPIFISGTAEMLPKGRFLPTPSKVMLSFGKPVFISKGATKTSVATIEHTIFEMRNTA